MQTGNKDRMSLCISQWTVQDNEVGRNKDDKREEENEKVKRTRSRLNHGSDSSSHVTSRPHCDLSVCAAASLCRQITLCPVRTITSLHCHSAERLLTLSLKSF